MTGSPWLVEQPGSAAARRLLLCLPYAGAGAAVFAPWRAALPDTAIVAVRLPGRESRFREPPLERAAPVVDALAPAVRDLLARHPGRPWSVFGYSLGGLLAYELVSSLAADGGPTPHALVVGGAEAPQVPRVEEPVAGLPEPAFLEHVLAMGGTPPEVLAHPELLEIVLPALRADFAVLESYAWTPRPPLSCPVVVHRAADDREVRRDTVLAWSELTTAPTVHHALPGGHFAIVDDPAAYAALVGDDLDRVG